MTNSLTETMDRLLDGRPNLSLTQRALYVGAGLGLAAAAVKPRPNPLLNVLALAGGSYLAWRGYVGQCPVKAALDGESRSGARRFAEHSREERFAGYVS